MTLFNEINARKIHGERNIFQVRCFSHINNIKHSFCRAYSRIRSITLFGLQRWLHRCLLYNLVVDGFRQLVLHSINGYGVSCSASVFYYGDRFVFGVDPTLSNSIVVLLPVCCVGCDIDTDKRLTKKSNNRRRRSAVDRRSIVGRIRGSGNAWKAIGTNSLDSWTHTTTNTGWYIYFELFELYKTRHYLYSIYLFLCCSFNFDCWVCFFVVCKMAI